MGTELMGCVTAEIVVENLRDVWDVERGLLAPEKLRRAVVADALVDTGATTLSLPTRFVDELGLARRSKRQVRTSAGPALASMCDTVRLTILGRDCTVDVMEVPDTMPALVGQIPLELLDLVVDPSARRLSGNPSHGGEQVLELF